MKPYTLQYYGAQTYDVYVDGNLLLMGGVRHTAGGHTDTCNIIVIFQNRSGYILYCIFV